MLYPITVLYEYMQLFQPNITTYIISWVCYNFVHYYSTCFEIMYSNRIEKIVEVRIMIHFACTSSNVCRPSWKNSQHSKQLYFFNVLNIPANAVLYIYLQEWVDEFMQWDPKDFNNISTLRIPCHKLWLPDIVLYNK